VVDLITFSPEWRRVYQRGYCPNGHKGPFEYNEGTGLLVKPARQERIPSKGLRIGIYASNPVLWPVLAITAPALSRIPKVTAYREDSSFRCDQCNESWKVFYRAEPTDDVVALGLTTTQRSSVSMGYDDSVRDNRTGTESMIATVRVSRRWQQKVEVLWEETKTRSATARVNLSLKYAGTEVEGKIEQSLKSSLSLSSETEQVLEQTLQVTVPAHRKITIRLHWKQIWQEGQITVRFSDGTTAQIPYRAAVDVGFDQENIQT
jgi:hypothetical protein